MSLEKCVTWVEKTKKKKGRTKIVFLFLLFHKQQKNGKCCRSPGGFVKNYSNPASLLTLLDQNGVIKLKKKSLHQVYLLSSRM